jgi:hypothetical protein
VLWLPKHGRREPSMLTRAAYLSRLRRAFLIRVHPDRLHSVKDDLLRVQQAAAVQAIIQRLQESDVAEWQQSSSAAGTSSTQASRGQHSGPMSRSVQCLVLPLNSGNNATIHKAKIRLNSNVNVLLGDLSDALRQSGAAEIPMPLDDSSFASSPTKRPPSANHHHYQSGSHDEPHAAPQTPPRLQRRMLNEFLSTVQMSTIAERKQSRLEAHAVAASVRNAYGFLAVDATRIGWSSQSVVILLRRLLSVQAEFASTVRPSYYPWKLVFSSSVCEEGAIDLHGAMLLLNPAGTNVQWLCGLELVNGSTNQAMLQIREEMDIFVKRLQSTWSVRLRKGFTCTSRAYYGALKRLCDEVTALFPDSNCVVVDRSSTTSLPSVEDVDVVIEDYTVCSRPQVTKSGSIMLGTRVTAVECKGAVETLSLEANRRGQLFKEEKALSRQAARQAQQCLGLERVFFDDRTLSPHDFRQSLGRLVAKSDEYNMVGHLLEIVATDHFCHIADDGALVIPHNWC